MTTDSQAAVDDALALTFSSREAAEAWLDRPHPWLGQRTPRRVLRDGDDGLVLACLEAINSGFSS